MSYSLLPHGDEEAAAFPPAYSSSSSSAPSGPAQNYVHLNAPDEDLVTSLTLDTDQPAVFGRFKDEQEQKDAKTALLGGRFVDVKIALQGSQRAKLELQQNPFTFHRRVVQISQVLSDAAHLTHFEVQVTNEGANCIVVVPESFSGAVVGNMRLSPALAARATCLVKDGSDASKTRMTVAPRAGSKPSTGGVETYSCVSNVRTEKSKGAMAGQCRVMTQDEYALDWAEPVRAEWEEWQTVRAAFWPRRLLNADRRMAKFGKKGARVPLYIAFVVGMLYFALFLLVVVAIATNDD